MLPGEANRVLGGKYRLQHRLGRGGMGSVWQAEHLALSSVVAVKLIDPGAAADPEVLQRFLREARVVAQLRSPHVVQVLDYGVDGDTPFIVMERLEGESLHDRLTRQGRLGLEETSRVVQQVARALTRAHEAGVVHRDLKPENVFVVKNDDDELLKVLDFGIAKASPTAFGESALVATRSGVLLGTPQFMSPEQFGCYETIDFRSDIWSLGVLAFKCLLGRLPFASENLGQLLVAICSQAPPVPSEIFEVPAGFDAWFERACAREPSARFDSARQAAAEFSRLARGLTSQISRCSSAEVPDVDVAQATHGSPRRPALRPANNLPAQITPFVGRETELRLLADVIADPDVHLVTILAPGGMGKSRLAIEAGRRLAEGVSPFDNVFARDTVFSRGVFFVDLAPLGSSSMIQSALAEAVGFRFYPGSEPRRQLLDYFRGKSLLLVMDNFEHLVGDVAIVREILEAAPDVKVIATSRERLALSVETLLVLEGMGSSERLESDDLSSSAAQLFSQTARRAHPGFKLEAKQARDVQRICQLVQGMPLGIVLAASWVGMLAAGEIADEISKSLDFLAVDLSDVPERQRSLRVVFEQSWGLLGEDVRAVLASLSVFRGGFTRGAAEAVAQARLPELATLMNKSLVQRGPDGGRYEIHELLRQYAQGKLQQSRADHDQARDRHAKYYAQFLHRAAARLASGSAVALGEVDAELGNVRAAWGWMLEQRRLDDVGAALHGLGLYFELRASTTEAEEAFQGVLEAFTPRDQAPEGQLRRSLSLALSLLVICRVQQARYQGLRELVERVLGMPDPTEHPGERALALVTAAWAMIGKESAQQIDAWAEQGLALYRASNDSWGLVRALWMVNRAHLVHENLERSEAGLRESIAIQQALGSETVFMSRTLIELGYTRMCRGFREEGLELVQQGLASAERLGDRSLERGLLHLTSVQLSLGDYGAAEQTARQTLELCQESGNRFTEAWTHTELGNILKHTGRYAEAISHYRACLEGSMDDVLGSAELNLGDVALLEGRYEEAKAWLTASLSRFEKAEIRWGVMLALENLGHLASEQGQDQSALEHFRRAFQAGGALNGGRFVGSVAAGVAQILARTGQRLLAVELLGLGKCHPATEQFTLRRRIDPLLAQLTGQLPAEDLAAALERGKSLDFGTVLQNLAP